MTPEEQIFELLKLFARLTTIVEDLSVRVTQLEDKAKEDLQ